MSRLIFGVAILILLVGSGVVKAVEGSNESDLMRNTSEEFDIPQAMKWEPPWRSPGDCGPAAVYVLMRLLGKSVTLADVEEAIPHDPVIGCSLEALANGANELDFPADVRFVKPHDVSKVNVPFILHTGLGLNQKQGHFVVVVAVDREKGNFRIIQTDQERLLWVPKTTVLDQYSGYVLVPRDAALRWQVLGTLNLVFMVILAVLLMKPRREGDGGHFQASARMRQGVTLVELLVVIAIIGILTALILPAVQYARESARRMTCGNHLRQISLGLHHYHDAHRWMPPGAIVTSPPSFVTICQSGNGYQAVDPIDDAARGSGFHGTSWMLRLLPYIEQGNLLKQWDFRTSVIGNRSTAEVDIPLFYCPSRRSHVDNTAIMFANWTAGGNDYGGCLGACNGYHNCGRHEFWVVPDGRRPTGPCKGIFGAQRSARLADVTDGASNTIMVGEVQRLDEGHDVTTSRDGWAVGGVSTHFSTCSDECKGPNAKHFEEPGSHHANGVQFGMADGAVHFLSGTIDRAVFKALGSMGQEDGTSSF